MIPTSSNKILFTNGLIFAGKRPQDPVWNNFVSVENGLITAVGNHDDQPPSGNSTEIIDLKGNLLLPGLCDAHLHLAVGGRSLTVTDLVGLDEIETGKALLEASRKTGDKPEQWIRAFNWEPSRFNLTAAMLEKWLPGRRVFVYQRDLHGCCCSFEALKLAGYTPSTPDPVGGKIGRDKDNALNGLLYESAIDPVSALIPEPTPSDKRDFILKGQRYLLSRGLTAASEVIDRGNEKIYFDLDRSGELLLDIDGWMRWEHWDKKSSPPPAGQRIHINTLKVFLDGSFGSGTAALIEPYTDNPQSYGQLYFKDNELRDLARFAQNKGWKLALHAIGDRAVKQACDVLGALYKTDRVRHRVEHLQMLPPDYVEHIAESGIIASLQPVHLLDDQRWLCERIGNDRCRNAFVWRSLIQHGVPVALGSDWPVADPNPLLNLQAVINRAEFNGQPEKHFALEEALTPIEAIRAMADGWAVAAGRKNRRGAIATGQTADFTLISGHSEDLRDWSHAKVEMTVCGGRVAYLA